MSSTDSPADIVECEWTGVHSEPVRTGWKPAGQATPDGWIIVTSGAVTGLYCSIRCLEAAQHFAQHDCFCYAEAPTHTAS